MKYDMSEELQLGTKAIVKRAFKVKNNAIDGSGPLATCCSMPVV